MLEMFDNVQLILNILQIIANVSEEPRGRKKMLENINYVEKFSNHDFLLIKQQAKITKEIIIWRP
jgi:hypothetical protein